MTMHGFGVGTTSTVDETIMKARQLSNVKGIIWVHRITEINGYTLLFEFGHHKKFGYNDFDQFLKAVEKTGVKNIQLYKIQESYKG
ncbi:MAG: hypothetical protein JSV51_08780 [Candidatus Bathyarchaeota archaeon]|nr:MAG: hypothetical protein JSV51_08780 [Candidatus Bathyarchaeota archaeon]